MSNARATTGLVVALRSPLGALAASSLAVIALGLLLYLVSPAWSGAVLLVGLIATGAPIVWRTAIEARRGHWATDVIAVTANVTAVLLREPLAGLVIVVMRSGGEALDQYAAARASTALRELEEAAPRIAHRLRGTADASVDDVPVSDIAIGESQTRCGRVEPNRGCG